MWLLFALGCWDTEPPVGAHCTLARTVQLPTDDGATVALHHHAGRGPPVLLVHGISSNHRFFDLDAERSMAGWLAERGWDVWALDLRGHGAALRDADGRLQQAGWTLDDYGRHDVPAAVAHVRACTGYETVHYVGHSMGGMVGAIYAATGGADALASVTYLGSPGTFTRDAPIVRAALTSLDAGGTALLAFDTRPFAETAADLRLHTAIQARLYNRENYTPESIERMLRTVVSPISRGEMRHFARMIRRERFTSWDGSVDYLAALRDVEVPALLVAGMADGIVQPAWVEAYADAFGGPVELVRAGTAYGFATDYGHLDYVLGERADEEIYPRVGAWLMRWPARRALPPER